MQIVIEIPKEEYLLIRHYQDISPNKTHSLAMSIINGTPLPKGHGRLIDAEEMRTKSIDVNAEFGNEWWCVDCDDIELAPTVLEADKEREE